ncbi:bifunctional serine/threonine-protein kinase/ABC transporter substrate-binding protein [Streptomyces albipurpureus]|uniref:ABC transporter substrate-binding protein n=1 Tax=Streptomyces albipurpureus TaxID=2897419 RepID=A0ABT0V2W2_9ACTN|nr:ABC transporter substrate-binding protein [Streptomyces sp. CWNU-1]MCM2393878.1 ABC transporter substrate-binding protein [Streptomyces sp. CWNU-1]
MDPLKTGDPSSIAGYRLLGRLGAGGMGVVYLARSERGALAAVKVIRAEYAADPGFRARFRRETETAQRITGRWVVRVVGADHQAREPWLATEFIPGPSLSEAVAVHGPLPHRTVRALGVRLAEALAGAHRVGLVHRDVKPGNVLLALDGPRLIDFGIARSMGATALTTDDVMVGSPGYLSPEQAKLAGAAEIGPPSDIFALGCVLAYATTGRRPFGTGTVAAIVFRTVHEEPDLEGIPPELLALVRACLSKQPADRPTATEVRAALRGPGPEDMVPGSTAAFGAGPVTGTSDAVADGEAAATGPKDAVPDADADAVIDPRAAFFGAPGEGAEPDPTSPETRPLGRATGADARAAETQAAGPRTSEAQTSEPWAAQPRAAEAQTSEPWAAQPRAAEAQKSPAQLTGRGGETVGGNPPGPPLPPGAEGVPVSGATTAVGADDEVGTAAGDWLPDGLPALIAQRSSRVLDLPVPESTVVVNATTTAAPVSRRLLVLGSAAAVATIGGAAAWLASRPTDGGDDQGADGTEGTGGLTRHVIGVQTDLSGPRKADGRAQERGARLAVEMFNARPDRPFDLALKVLDDAGDPVRARVAAAQHGADSSIVAVLGLTTFAVAKAVVARYGENALPVLSVSLGTTPMDLPRSRGYFELQPADHMQIAPVERYFALHGSERIAVIRDLAGDKASWSMVKWLGEAYAGVGRVAVHNVEARSDDFSTVVRAALATTPDGVIHVGNSPSRAALTARALRDQGFTGLKGSIEPVLEPEFLTRAGQAAEGWVFGTTYIDPARLPTAKPFNAAYRRRWKTDTTERHAAEAYDAVLFLAQGMRELGEGRVRRSALVNRLRQLKYQGITKPIAFRSSTQSFDETSQRVGLYLHRVEGGRARFLGPYLQVTAKT